MVFFGFSRVLLWFSLVFLEFCYGFLGFHREKILSSRTPFFWGSDDLRRWVWLDLEVVNAFLEAIWSPRDAYSWSYKATRLQGEN